MRWAIGVALFGLLLGGCYCSHQADDDAPPADAGGREDASVPVDVGTADAGPPPICGVAEPASGPLCGGSSACAAESRALRSFGGVFELYPRIEATDDAILIAFRDSLDLLPVATIRAGEVTFREAPLTAFGSGLLARAAGVTYMLGRDAATGRSTILRVEEAAFVEVPAVLGMGNVGPGFAGDSAGCLHVLLNGDEGLERWIVRDDRAHLVGLVDGWYASTLRVDAAGEVQVVAASREGLLWVAGGRVEPVDAELVATGSNIWVRFGVAGTVPHVLYESPTVTGAELRHAWRGSAGWEMRVLGTTTASGCTGEEMPTGPGDTCELERTSLSPLAVLADRTGEVRLLYGESIERATLTASCGGEDVPPDWCSGWDWESTFEGVLHVAAVGDISAEDLPLPGLAITGGRAIALDSAIHVALELRGAAGNELHHVALSPR